MNAEAFFDTNVLLYLLTKDEKKAARSEELLSFGGVISVQVLNEFASVATKKYKMQWPQIHQTLSALRANLAIVPVTLDVHEHGMALIELHKFAVYDGMIVAAALLAGCKTLYSEDMHDGLVIKGLNIKNPYAF